MVKASKFTTAQYLSAKTAGEFNGKKFTINAAFSSLVGSLGKEKEKLLVRLEGIDKPLVLNQTNLAMLTIAYGDDTDQWINNKVILNLVSVSYNGQIVLGIQLTPCK